MRKRNSLTQILGTCLLVVIFLTESYGKISSAGLSFRNESFKRKLEVYIAKNRPSLSLQERLELVSAMENAALNLRLPSGNQKERYDKLGFLVGLVHTESQFHRRAKSHKGALGLMQVMPTTARWLAEKEGIPFSGERDLYDPETNLYIGVLYLNYLIERTDSLEAALLSYNAGLGGYKRFGGIPEYSRSVYRYYEEWKSMPTPTESLISETVASLLSI
ncbi:transglycosylase-like protein with SLT domain [Leptospira meyeri]|uniref:Transglycosylase-like protein with SLT domain n=1 Tax=Leptospira meyeri TaxID=29508 RepID=A0A4R8MZH6_LEPME|nr:lytic transglycosylase domain-containing protein [Leptospira meyeri]EKJ86281.1 transglycosylase SLT domain protein [Leptospira meyeri serovar Hardjo str. Went 5]TDY72386.1 transglycosylase-like protein with SLT domain [Leptospira meyeri]TGL46113.1 lytic transglycosylase domain-containing protein [Leptospira meyeri]